MPKSLYSIFRLRRGRVLLPALLVLLAACSPADPVGTEEWQSVPLPELASEVELRVLIVTNPRFPQLADADIQRLLAASARNTERFFQVPVSFSEPAHSTIDEFFDVLPGKVQQVRADEIVAVDDSTRIDYARMRASLRETLENYAGNRERVIDYALPYLEEAPPQRDFDSLAAALADTMITRLQYWQQQHAADGKPVLDEKPWNEWVWWDSIGYGEMPYDVVITNQLVASAEYYAMDVHSSIRGGITAGTTSFSRATALDAYSWITLYPLLNDSPLLNLLRDDADYTTDEVVEFGAALLTHELGHLLLHLGHPFGSQACIMAPMPLLKYREWSGRLDPDRCTLGSEPQMRPGAASIDYRVDLLE